MQPKRQQIKETSQKAKRGDKIAKGEEKFTLLFQIYNVSLISLYLLYVK